MDQFLWGALAMACLAVTLLFLRFWRLSHERLYLFFSLGFLALGLTWAGVALLHPDLETRPLFYVLRLLAFLLIIAGIVDKNRRAAGNQSR